jgi:hypothetical protein
MDEVTAESFEDTLARRWKVFVSSTTDGLRGFRDVAGDVIRDFRYAGMRCFEPVMMEDFGAQDGAAREVCAKEIRECDLLVGIIGIRYGDHPPKEQTSFTEIEFQTALEERLPRLMFLLTENVARELEGAKPQEDDRADRQEQFRNRIEADRVAETDVVSEEDFSQKLTRALQRWAKDYSFTRAMVDHREEFRAARSRLLRLGERTGGATLIFGEPGTGKTTLLNTLLEDIPVRHAYRCERR